MIREDTDFSHPSTFWTSSRKTYLSPESPILSTSILSRAFLSSTSRYSKVSKLILTMSASSTPSLISSSQYMSSRVDLPARLIPVTTLTTSLRPLPL